MSNLAQDFVILARQLAAVNYPDRAFSMYMCAIYRDPRIKKQLENEFREVLSKMNEQLAAVEDKPHIFDNFEKAIELFPGNVNLLHDIGSYLYRYGYFSEALCHFEKALNIDSSSAKIEKNLNNTKTFLFPRNQFRILNDTKRNAAYRAAIRSCVTNVDSVLDIDTATGLLALYANERNPVVITACVSSNMMASLAECVMQDNNAQEVVIVNKPSVLLKHTDIYGTRSVLLTDMIDSGLFGEVILQSLCHAWEHLLYENSKVIPGKAEYFVVGVKCDELNNKYKLCQDIKDILNVSHMNVHTTAVGNETYFSEDVHMYENLKYMSEPTSLFKIDFNNYQDVYEKLHRQEPYNAQLTATEDGEVNMIIGWFDLYLTDSIMLTNNPRSADRASAYQQAVFFDVLPRNVRRNDIINIPFTTNGGKLTMIPDVEVPISRISPVTIAYLNDAEYMSMVTKTIGTVCVHLGQTVEIEEVNIVDLSPFPLFGVLMMRRGANSLVCHAKTADDKAFLLTVLVANGIPESKVEILVTDYWSYQVFDKKKFHVVFNQVIDFNGDVDANRIGIAQHLKLEFLMPGGICLPSSVTMMGQLISSHHLEINNRVVDSNVDCRMAKHVNRYQVSQALHLDHSRLEYDALSEVFEIRSCDIAMSDVVKVPITKDGDCNAILCWYKIQMLEDWKELYTNRSNSFVRSMAYMPNPNAIKVFRGDHVNVIKCVDMKGPFKIVLDVLP